jgi:hypothetical protein
VLGVKVSVLGDIYDVVVCDGGVIVLLYSLFERFNVLMQRNVKAKL